MGRPQGGRAGMPRLGKARPRHRFFLNPYSDARFTVCPICRGKMRLRKLPLVVHVDPMELVAPNKSCRYCPGCDLPIVRHNELEPLLAATFGQRKPEVVGNDDLVVGTLERADWLRGTKTPLLIPEVFEHRHDFREALRFEPAPAWGPA